MKAVSEYEASGDWDENQIFIYDVEPGSAGSVVARGSHTNPAAELFWHLDNTYLGSTRDIHQMTIAPTRGVHTITVVDSSGAMQHIEIIII